MHKGMISGLTASAIKTQTFVNINGGVSFSSPIFRRAFSITSAAAVTFGVPRDGSGHVINGPITFSSSGSVSFSGSVTFNSIITCTGTLIINNAASYIGVDLGLGSTINWGVISVQDGIRASSGFWVGPGGGGYSKSTFVTEICGDGSHNVVAIRNYAVPQTFRIYRTTTAGNNGSNGPHSSNIFERVELKWRSTGNFEAVLGTSFGISGGSPRGLILATSDIDRVTIAAGGAITVADGLPINFGATSGTQLWISGGQKIGFWGATPVVRPTAVTTPSGGATIDSECRASLSDLITKLQSMGLIS